MERDAMPEKQIRTASLKTGDKIELGWAPDCTCEIEYIGDSCFRVEESSNNKLCKGDTFKTLIFNLNKPLYVSELEHGDSKQCTYITGKDNGLTTLQLTIGQSDATAK